MHAMSTRKECCAARVVCRPSSRALQCRCLLVIAIISEKDLNEVLQSLYIFTNVSKGVTANNADLNLVFKTTDVQTIAIEVTRKRRNRPR